MGMFRLTVLRSDGVPVVIRDARSKLYLEAIGDALGVSYMIEPV